MRILIVHNEPSYPPTSGVKLRNYNLLRRIAARHQVWLAVHPTGRETSEAMTHLRGLCESVVTSTPRRTPPTFRAAAVLRYIVTGTPIYVQRRYSPHLANEIHRLTAEVDFDIVHIEESFLAIYRDAIPHGKAEHLLTFHNVCFDQAGQLARVAPNSRLRLSFRLQSRQMRGWEPRYAERFDYCCVVSESDRHRLQAVSPRLHIGIVPNGVDTRRCRVLAERSGPPALVFVGRMGYLACVDGATYLVREILPLVRREIPDIELWIVGSNPAAAVSRLASERVYVTGQVEDVQPFYERSTVCVVPIRGGGGTRLKILEAMAFGRPVVSTSIGAEGLGAADEEHLLLADRPEEFARQIVRLLRDPALRKRLSVRARQLVESCYDWDIVAEEQMRIYEALLGQSRLTRG